MNVNMVMAILILIAILVTGCMEIIQDVSIPGVSGKMYCDGASPVHTCAAFETDGDYLYWAYNSATAELVSNSALIGTWWQDEPGRYNVESGNYTTLYVWPSEFPYRTVWICETSYCEGIHEEGNPVIFRFEEYLPADVSTD